MKNKVKIVRSIGVNLIIIIALFFTISIINVRAEEKIPVHFEKIDKVANERLAGAELTIMNDSGEIIDIWQSDGTEYELELEPGEYYLTETLPPDGYGYAQPYTITVIGEDELIVNGEEMPEVIVENQPLKPIYIEKRDAATGDMIDGAVLCLSPIDDQHNPGEKIGCWTTNSNQQIIINGLPYGDYILEETAAPEGYAKIESVLITVGDDVIINDEVQPDRTIIIYDAYSAVEYTIKHVEQGNPEHVLGTETGYASPGNIIYVQEDPSGFTGYTYVNKSSETITIDENTENNIAYVYYNRNNYQYTVNHFDKDTNELLDSITASAPYQSTILAQDEVLNIAQYRYDSSDNASITISTNKNRNILNLYYTKTSMQVIFDKQDFDTGESLAGAELCLYNTQDDNHYIEGDIIQCWMTEGTEKEITLDSGYYIVNEITPPLDYVGDASNILVRITDNSELYVNDQREDKVIIYNQAVHTFEYTIKHVEEGNPSNVLREDTEQAVYGEVVDVNEDTFPGYYYTDKSAETITISDNTDENIAYVYYTRANYQYTVNYYDKITGELLDTATDTAPYQSIINASDKIIDIPNYQYDSSSPENITISINTNRNILNLYYTKKTAEVSFEKQDDLTEDTLAGAHLCLYREEIKDENLVECWDSEHEDHKINLVYGNYVLEEEYPPEGYEMDSENKNITVGDQLIVNGVVSEKVIIFNTSAPLLDIEYTIKHVEQGNPDNVLGEETNYAFPGDTIPVNQLTFPGYVYVSKSAEFITVDWSEDNIAYVYYKKADFEYTVNYYDKNTNELLDTITDIAPYLSTINTSDKIIDINDYEYDSVDKESITININTNQNVLNLYYTKKAYEIRFDKHDVETDTSLAGASLCLYYFTDNYDEDPIDCWASDYSEHIIVLESGKYLLVETNAPEGYNISESLIITVGNQLIVNDEVQNDNKVIMYDQLLPKYTYTIKHVEQGNISNELRVDTGTASYGSNVDVNETNFRGYTYVSKSTDYINIISDENENIAYVYYKKNNYQYTVNHYDKNTNQLLDTTTNTAPYQSTIRAVDEIKNINNYQYDSSNPENITINTSANDNILNLYYTKKTGSVTVHHYIENTTTKLAEDEIITKNYGEEYTTSKKTFDNYQYVSVDGNPSGTVNTDNIEVTYYYKINNGTITVHHYLEGTTTKLAEDEIITKNHGEEYTTSKKTFDDYEYVSVEGNPTGIMGNENITVTYYYKNKAGTITVHHYIEGTTTKLAEDEIIAKSYGEEYTTSKKTFDNYEYVSVDENPTGTVGNNDIVITYYYKAKDARLVVKYLEKGTNQVLAPEYTHNYHYGDTYNAPEATVDQMYSLDSISGTVSGTVNEDLIEVTYFYTKKPSDILDDLTKTGTDTVTSSNDLVEYKIKYEAKITNYKGPVSIKILDELPYEIDKTKSTLDDGVYSKEDKTITWQINYDQYNSQTDEPIKITKNIKVSYKNLAKIKTIINNVHATITLDDMENTILTTKTTNVAIPGTLTVKYVDENNNPIADSDNIKGFVGEKISIKAKDIESYKLYEKPEQEIITLKEDNITVVYRYKKLKFNIITKVKGGGGTITGDEVVEYGKDEVGSVVITAKKGYHIKSLKINNKKQKINDNTSSLKLEKFKKMTEDKLIIVEFEKQEDSKDVKIPDTGSAIPVVEIAAGTAMAASGGYILYRRYKH